MINFIADYKDGKTGRNVHQAFQVDSNDRTRALDVLLAVLHCKGHDVNRVGLIHGVFTLAELMAIADAEFPPRGCVIELFIFDEQEENYHD